MILREKQHEKAYTNKELQELLRQYPDKALVMFQDFNFNSSKKELIKDVIYREETYPNYEEKGCSIILVSKFLNLKKK